MKDKITFKNYNDGFYWTKINSNFLNETINTSEGDTLYCLNYNNDIVIVIGVNEKYKIITKIKDINGLKPIFKYHSYIIDLLIDNKFIAEKFFLEYDDNNDLKINDLNDSLFEKLITNKPLFISENFNYNRLRNILLKSPGKLNEIKSNLKTDKEIICYHRSKDLKHMKNSDFSLEYSDNEYSIFGGAFYFSTSSNITIEFGRYLCKFKIKLEEPVFDLNKEMSNAEANKLLYLFIDKYNKKIKYYDRGISEYSDKFDFNDGYDRVQYGEFFLELQDIIPDIPNEFFMNFIHFLGYKSFKYYQDFGTNFITKKDDYGICYGIYNPKNIRFVDGPF